MLLRLCHRLYMWEQGILLILMYVPAEDARTLGESLESGNRNKILMGKVIVMMHMVPH